MPMMKPGDVVTIRSVYTSSGYPVYGATVFKRAENDWTDTENVIGDTWKWEKGEIGTLLEGYEPKSKMLPVLHQGRPGWIGEEYLILVVET